MVIIFGSYYDPILKIIFINSLYYKPTVKTIFTNGFVQTDGKNVIGENKLCSSVSRSSDVETDWELGNRIRGSRAKKLKD